MSVEFQFHEVFHNVKIHHLLRFVNLGVGSIVVVNEKDVSMVTLVDYAGLGKEQNGTLPMQSEQMHLLQYEEEKEEPRRNEVEDKIQRHVHE